MKTDVYWCLVLVEKAVMSEPDVLTEVPASLKLLVRIIMRCFYGDEHAIVMDKLIHHPCIKEDDLLELLRFERKQLRAVITTLRNEKVGFLSGFVTLANVCLAAVFTCWLCL